MFANETFLDSVFLGVVCSGSFCASDIVLNVSILELLTILVPGVGVMVAIGAISICGAMCGSICACDAVLWRIHRLFSLKCEDADDSQS